MGRRKANLCICCLVSEAMAEDGSEFCGACDEMLLYNLPAAGWTVNPPKIKEKESKRASRYNRYSEGRHLDP